jgi:hypothetical protein
MYIPNEIYLKIFSNLDYKELSNLLLVDKNFNNLSKIIILKKDKLTIKNCRKVIESHLIDIAEENYYIAPLLPLKKLVKDNLNYFRYFREIELRMVAFLLLEYEPDNKYKEIIAYHRDPKFEYLETDTLDELYYTLNLNKYTCIM